MGEVRLGLYQHFRGNFYHVIGLCRHSETLEAMGLAQSNIFLFNSFLYSSRTQRFHRSRSEDH
ncbi:MAG: hypothetical protein ACD_16C00130G0047 [uncultured bacterium]|nr:MAG: hypothetical protein ACD_16C00130G0047 [uncultured bacterium]HBG34781.1 hypothetical protein [Holosporales bacterium]HBW24557.1 hypothetical protein [Holosporales bacterium]HCC25318.1 hypothetical protein [Holosporales bacterium]HCE95472.1 hypothetical protein [Holosporales bacterium]